jgi:nucleoside-diphosphate-sugar epimerase
MAANRSTRALVIGSEGNIGSRLVGYLRAAGYDVMEADIRPRWRDGYLMADVNNPLDLLPAFDWQPDVVFMLAAAVGRMTCEQAGSLSVATNLGGLNNVLQLCKRSECMCVYASSSEVYGPECDPMDDVASLPRPNNRYGLSKWLGEQLVEYEVHRCGLRAVSVRLCMIYDEEEDIGEHRSAMIRFAANLARKRSIEVHRGSVRGWLHVLDAVRAIEAASRVPEYMAINIGNPHLLPIPELAEMIRAELGADPSLVKSIDLPSQMTLVKRLTLDRQRFVLGVEPEISITEGVRRVCAHQSRLAHLETRAPSILNAYTNGAYTAPGPIPTAAY